MHESTVSRVTANKYIATPRGTFELKYFFTTAIAGTVGGESHSAEAVRYRIREHDRRRSIRRTSCRMTRSSSACGRKAWTSPGERWPNTARRCASHHRCSASGRRPSRPDLQRSSRPERRRRLRPHRRGGLPNRGRSHAHMHITVAGKQVETGEALKTHVRDGLDDHRAQVFRPCAGSERHLPPRRQGPCLLRLRHQPEGRARPVHARRGRGRRTRTAPSRTPPSTSPSACAATAAG